MGAPRHDWYLREWLAASGKRQRDIVNDLEWNKARASLMVNCKQQYDRDSLNELAEWPNIRPYELLMHPKDAHALRALRNDAIRIAQSSDLGGDDDEAKKVSLG